MEGCVISWTVKFRIRLINRQMGDKAEMAVYDNHPKTNLPSLSSKLKQIKVDRFRNKKLKINYVFWAILVILIQAKCSTTCMSWYGDVDHYYTYRRHHCPDRSSETKKKFLKKVRKKPKSAFLTFSLKTLVFEAVLVTLTTTTTNLHRQRSQLKDGYLSNWMEIELSTSKVYQKTVLASQWKCRLPPRRGRCSTRPDRSPWSSLSSWAWHGFLVLLLVSLPLFDSNPSFMSSILGKKEPSFYNTNYQEFVILMFHVQTELLIL